MKRIIAVVLLLALLLGVIPAAQADLMGDARSMLQMINDFRTGDNTWYWNRDNTTVTRKKNLGRLEYDEELEAVALVRARELAEVFDHTRPDGTDCFTAFPDNRSSMAENIACGYLTAWDAFEGFLEEDEYYAGQGHRRIMLSENVSRVGFAAVEIGGVRYWVQEFGSAPIDGSSTGLPGWEQKGDRWYYRKADGNLVTGWMKQGGNWFYMDTSGVMQTGWLQDGGNWYYMKDTGEMTTGWMKLGENWFYMNSTGVRQHGWLKDGGHWYFMNQDGVMQTGWVNDGGTRYYMNASGEMVTGWKRIGNHWYYLQPSGAMLTGWLKENGKWYYMNISGEMVTGRVSIGGSIEVFGDDGVWKHTELQDYGTPLGAESEAVRIIKAVVQLLTRILFGVR